MTSRPRPSTAGKCRRSGNRKREGANATRLGLPHTDHRTAATRPPPPRARSIDRYSAVARLHSRGDGPLTYDVLLRREPEHLLVGACGGASGLGDGQTEEDANDEARSSRAHRRPGTSMASGGGRRLTRLSGCLGGLGPGLGDDLDCLGRFQRMHTLDEVLIIFWHRHDPLSLQPELFDRRFRVMAAGNTVRGTV